MLLVLRNLDGDRAVDLRYDEVLSDDPKGKRGFRGFSFKIFILTSKFLKVKVNIAFLFHHKEKI